MTEQAIPPLITAADHLVLICPDIAGGVQDYSALLGARPAWRADAVDDGAATALFRVANTSLELLAPKGEGPVGDRLREMLAEGGPRLASVAFETDDANDARHVLERRGLAPSDLSEGSSLDLATRSVRRWRRFRCSDDAMAGVKAFVLQNVEGDLNQPEAGPGAATALDHLVIETPNPDRAVAIYGGRLGLRLALDRTIEQFHTRFLFFRVGGLTFEIIHRTNQAPDPAEPDRFWGLTWATDDLDAARERLGAAGREVSEIRKGRKPGSRVFTVRDGTLGVPTLFIAHAPR